MKRRTRNAVGSQIFKNVGPLFEIRGKINDATFKDIFQDYLHNCFFNKMRTQKIYANSKISGFRIKKLLLKWRAKTPDMNSIKNL